MIQFVTKSAAARLAASALLVAFDESGSYVAKYSDVPDDASVHGDALEHRSMLMRHAQQSFSALPLKRHETI